MLSAAGHFLLPFLLFCGALSPAVPPFTRPSLLCADCYSEDSDQEGDESESTSCSTDPGQETVEPESVSVKRVKQNCDINSNPPNTPSFSSSACL